MSQILSSQQIQFNAGIKPAIPRRRLFQPHIPSRWRIRSTTETELDEIDPMTGEIISGTSMATKAPCSLQSDGKLSWAYRLAESSDTSNKTSILALHGLGSSSYSYRNTLRLLSNEGHRSIALDWIGHGASDIPSNDAFDYSERSYIAALDKAVSALDLPEPFALIVHGYILGQYGLLWALENEDKLNKLIILNTPLSTSSKLRPELAAYKAPLAFMRPNPDARFDAANYNAAGSPYAMSYRDASAYAAVYEEDPLASAAVHATMQSVDFPGLLKKVDVGFQTWRTPSLVVHGGGDTFLDLKGSLDWLESKRTCMKMATGLEAKLGHMPQEDFAEGLHGALKDFLAAA